MCLMLIEPSLIEVIDFLRAGFWPSTATRSIGTVNSEFYGYTDFITDDALLDCLVESSLSSVAKYWHMNQLVSALTADLDAASDGSVRMSCMLLNCGSINFELSMLVNDYYVTYDLYFDIPCSLNIKK